VRSFVAKTVPVFLGFYRDAAPMGLDSILIFGLQRCRADGAGEPAGIQTGELNSSVLSFSNWFVSVSSHGFHQTVAGGGPDWL
jgi:hypothetical protein